MGMLKNTVDERADVLFWNRSLEDFLDQLNKNCQICEYEQKIFFKGSSECEINLQPQKNTSFVINSFRPNISIRISNADKAFRVVIISKLYKGTKEFLLVMISVLILMAICMLGLVFSDKAEEISNGFIFMIPLIIIGVILITARFSRDRALKDMVFDIFNEKKKGRNLC